MAAPIRSADLGNAILEELSDGKWATSENIAARVMDRIPPEALSRAMADYKTQRAAASWITCKSLYHLWCRGKVDKRKQSSGTQEYSVKNRHAVRRMVRAESVDAILGVLRDAEWLSVEEIAESIKSTHGACRAWIELGAPRYTEAYRLCMKLFRDGVLFRRKRGRFYEYAIANTK